MGKEKNKKDTNKHINKGSENKKGHNAIVYTMTGLIILSACAYLATSFNNSQNDNTDYDQIIEIVLEQSPEVNNNSVNKIVNKQISEKDYSLNTVLNTLNVNPAYIMVNGEIIHDADKIEKEINKIKNKKYDEKDMIELSWKTTENNLVTTYLASDIKDEVNVVGFFVRDVSFDFSDVKTNENVSKTDLDFKDIANLDLTLNDIESKVGKLHSYYIQYPLLSESKSTEYITADQNEVKSLIKKSIVRTEDSTILISAVDGKLKAIYQSLDTHNNIAKLDTDTFTKISENKKITEDEFLSLSKEAKLVAVELVEDGNNKSVRQHYLIKSNENEVYSIVFDDGAFNKIETIE